MPTFIDKQPGNQEKSNCPTTSVNNKSLVTRENCWAIIFKRRLSRQTTATNTAMSLFITAFGELFMPFFSAVFFSTLLNNLAVLSHCHYAKLYFHFIRNMCVGVRKGGRETRMWEKRKREGGGLSDYYLAGTKLSAVGEKWGKTTKQPRAKILIFAL